MNATPVDPMVGSPNGVHPPAPDGMPAYPDGAAVGALTPAAREQHTGEPE